VAAARAAFTNTWGKNVTGWERSRLLHKLADLMERDAQELAELESLNNGKPVRVARSVSVYRKASYTWTPPGHLLTYYAGTLTLGIVSSVSGIMLDGRIRLPVRLALELYFKFLGS
jgi:acyl-CoA reductase-like NAD-dependent aldehyde dehydrogenase